MAPSVSSGIMGGMPPSFVVIDPASYPSSGRPVYGSVGSGRVKGEGS